jgi:hypothetical protein
MHLKKWLKWEFLPFWVFYLPIYFYWIWLGIRAKSFVFFAAANPLMELGGFAAYSKYKVLLAIPEALRPLMCLLKAQSSLTEIRTQIQGAGLQYPFVLKPDRGERGFGVEKIENEADLQKYWQQYSRYDIIAQAWLEQPLEFGVMYHRLPQEAQGSVTSLVQKEFLSVQGDGQSSLEMLFKNHERTQYHLATLLKLYRTRLQEVLPQGQVLRLVEIGNHSRGTTFLNANHLINERLQASFDAIAKEIPGYYFGRFDLRTASLEDLYQGKVQIMELNGANSEPAHIYDPQMPIGKAYKHLFGHWQRLYRISRQNHAAGTAYPPLWPSIRQIKRHLQRKD